MTRINSAIRVRMLTDEHLLAEHREIKRLPSNYQKRRESGKGFSNLPSRFTLGTGHVLFFLDKNQFTYERYQEVRKECFRRGFSVEDYSENWEKCKSHWYTYQPTEEEKVLLKERITKRLLESTKPNWHYYGKVISKQEAIELLNKQE